GQIEFVLHAQIVVLHAQIVVLHAQIVVLHAQIASAGGVWGCMQNEICHRTNIRSGSARSNAAAAIESHHNCSSFSSFPSVHILSCMHIALISGGAGWHVRDLQRAASGVGHTTELLDFRTFSASVAAGPNSLDDFDAIVVRTMPPGSLEQVVFRMDLLHRVEQRGLKVLNPPRALEICIDKYLATTKLEAAGLPVPPTIVCQTAEDALAAFDSLGQDVIVKPLFGSEGRGMLRVSDPELAWRTFRTLERTSSVIYVQQFIRHPGWDLRVFVLGNEVIAAMRRHARQGWRTNVAQGGKAEKAAVSAKEEALALNAAQACGTLIAGVDLIYGPQEQLFVLEVNAVPGWRALAPVTGIDVAARIIGMLGRQS